MALTFASDKLHDILYRRGQTTGSVNVCFILRYKCKKELECLVYLKCLICNTRRSLNLKIADVKVWKFKIWKLEIPIIINIINILNTNDN